MTEHRDVFAPCLKQKNRVQLNHSEETKTALKLLKESGQAPTEDKLKKLLQEKLLDEEKHLKELPNFTSQADFALQ